MVLLKCGVRDCNYTTNDLRSFIFHHENHPNSDLNKFYCNQPECLKDFGCSKLFKAHLRKIHPVIANTRENFGGVRNVAPAFAESEINSDLPLPTVARVNDNGFETLCPDEHIIDCDIGPRATFYEEDKETDEFLLKIVLSLYGSKDLTLKHCQEIVRLFKIVSEKTSELCVKRIKNCLNLEEAENAIKDCPLINFDGYLSESKFIQKLVEKDLFREPSKFTIANEIIERVSGELENAAHLGVIMDIEFQIRNFLQIDGVLESILNFQDHLSSIPEGVFKNFINGRSWRKIISKEEYEGKTLIPLFLYNDDFQIDDKVGPHSSSNALSSFYYMFPTLPPHLSSKLDFIFNAMTIKAADLKVYGNRSALHALLPIFTKLAKDGVVLFEGTPKECRIYIIMCKVLGDNLGLHCICGFRKSFRMNRPCMYCEILLSDLQYITNLDPDLERTIAKYEAYFEEDGNAWDYGVESYSVLNSYPNFHVMENKVVDPMHDIQLGYINFILHKAIIHFNVTYPNFDLHLLNERIQNFDYGREQANKPGIILESHLDAKKKLHLNANESITLLRFFPLIIVDLIPFVDPIYQLVLETIETIDQIYAREFNEQTIMEMDRKIKANKRNYLRTFGPETYLKPKDHHMLHYKSVIEENGPLRGLSTIRLEGKHQVIKAYTNNNKNRKLICYGVSKKQAFEFANLLNKSKSTNILANISNFKKKGICDVYAVQVYLTNLHYDPGTFFSVDSFTFNGTKYNIGDFIIENAEVAAKITGMYVSEMNDLAVVSCDIHTIVFDNNLLFYEVRERIGNEVDLIINIPDCPTSIHKSGRRKYLKKLL